MTKRFFVLLMLLVSVSLMTAGIVSAQNYWNNPWNNLPSNTGNPFVNTSPMYPGTVQAPASCQPNCYGWQNCTVPSYCYSANCASFVADLTIPDGSYVAPGTSFTKTWRLRNNGTTVWTTNYKVIFSGGTQMGAPSWFALPHAVAPGQTVDITVSLTAPSTSGSSARISSFRLKTVRSSASDRTAPSRFTPISGPTPSRSRCTRIIPAAGTRMIHTAAGITAHTGTGRIHIGTGETAGRTSRPGGKTVFVGRNV